MVLADDGQIKIDQAMATAEKLKLECTGESGVGYIHTIEDVYNALVYYFTNSTKKDSQLSGRNPIHHYNFLCHLSKNDPIQRPDESFVTLDGISKRYQMVVKIKVLYIGECDHAGVWDVSTVCPMEHWDGDRLTWFKGVWQWGRSPVDTSVEVTQT